MRWAKKTQQKNPRTSYWWCCLSKAHIIHDGQNTAFGTAARHKPKHPSTDHPFLKLSVLRRKVRVRVLAGVSVDRRHSCGRK